VSCVTALAVQQPAPVKSASVASHVTVLTATELPAVTAGPAAVPTVTVETVTAQSVTV